MTRNSMTVAEFHSLQAQVMSEADLLADVARMLLAAAERER